MKEEVEDVLPMRPTRFYSNRQEQAVAKAIHGKQTANSGAGKWSKGDVRTADWLIECKTVTKPQSSFSVKKEWFDKNKEEAFAMHKLYSAVVFDFGDEGDRHYIIDEHLFKILVEHLEAQK